MPTTFNVILDTRRMKQDKTYPVKLRIIHNRVPKDYQTIFHLTKEDYDKLNAANLSQKLKEVNKQIKLIKKTTADFMDSMSAFDPLEFELKFIIGNPLFVARKIQEMRRDPFQQIHFDFTPYHKKFPILLATELKFGSLTAACQSYIKKLIIEGRIGSALCHNNSYTRLKNFKGDVQLSDITPGFLHQFEKRMSVEGKKLGYIGIITRDLRTIFNEAIAEGIIKRDLYPFGKRKYIVPKSKRVKKAIDVDQLGAFYNYQTTDVNKLKAKDYWLFCYLANGMNPKDVALLKFENIHGDFFTFNRAKTILTSRTDPKPVTVFLNDEMRAIIDKWGNKNQSPDNYIFPILEKGMTELEQHFMIRSFIRFINVRTKQIGKELNLSHNLTTIISRHSFSTHMKRSGASTELIQESLGHSDKSTTENYLDSFDNEVKKNYSNMLLGFAQKGKTT